MSDTPSVIATAVSSATSRPPSALASAITAAAVVAKKIQAPGFTITRTHAPRGGPEASAGPVDGRHADRLPPERAQLVQREVHEEEPPDDAETPHELGEGSTVENPSASVASTTNSMPLAPSITRNP